MCRYLLQLTTPASDTESAAADLSPLLEALLQISPDMRKALQSHRPSQEGSSGPGVGSPSSPDSGSPEPPHARSVQQQRNPESLHVVDDQRAPPVGASSLPAQHPDNSSSSSPNATSAVDQAVHSSSALEEQAGISSTGSRPGHSTNTSISSTSRPHDTDTGPNSADAGTAAGSSVAASEAVSGGRKHSSKADAGIAGEGSRAENPGIHTSRPACLFVACWTQPVPSQNDFEMPENVGFCGTPDAQISFDAAIKVVDSIVDRLYGAGTASRWADTHQQQDDESDDEAVEALSHALGEASTI